MSTKPGEAQFDTGANGSTERNYNNYRWYRPAWGDYTQVDPLNVAAEYPYTYSRNNPGNSVDPLGLRAFTCGCEFIGAFSLARKKGQSLNAFADLSFLDTTAKEHYGSLTLSYIDPLSQESQTYSFEVRLDPANAQVLAPTKIQPGLYQLGGGPSYHIGGGWPTDIYDYNGNGPNSPANNIQYGWSYLPILATGGGQYVPDIYGGLHSGVALHGGSSYLGPPHAFDATQRLDPTLGCVRAHNVDLLYASDFVVLAGGSVPLLIGPPPNPRYRLP